jgi:Tol biopolymer transport system component
MRRFYVLTILTIFICTFSGANADQKMKMEAVKLIGGDGLFFMRPVFSPDGSQIAFTASNYQGIWIMNSDGSQAREISDEPAAGFGFEWSSDSKAIVSRVARFEKKFRFNAVKVFDLETNDSRFVTNFRTMVPGLPHWGAWDEKIYMHGRGKIEVFDSGKKASALQKKSTPALACFLKDDQIAIGNPTAKEYKIYEPVKGERCINLVMSPDRSRVAFEIMGGNLFVMNVDGSGLVDLGEGHRPQWAPDSQHLIYMITTDDGYKYFSSDIYTIKIDGSGKTKLEFAEDKLEMNPSWSPDGKRIIFDAFDEGAIYMMEFIE